MPLLAGAHAADSPHTAPSCNCCTPVCTFIQLARIKEEIEQPGFKYPNYYLVPMHS
jgi:hypothetical protein